MIETNGNNQTYRFSALVDIPRFTQQESIEIEKLFHNHKIYFEKHSAQIDSGPAGGYHEFIFSVPKQQFVLAINLLKEYYGIGITYSQGFTGNCPACGTEVVNVIKCTNCGMTLAGDYTETFIDHPFAVFIKQKNLIEQPETVDYNSDNTNIYRHYEEIYDENPSERYTTSLIKRIGFGLMSLVFISFLVLLIFIVLAERQVHILQIAAFALVLLPIIFFLKKIFVKNKKRHHH